LQIWSRARALAEQTPVERNRYVDLLRAVAILVVIVGHWLIATAWYDQGELNTGLILRSDPWTQWLTLLFQVMPIFFMVGGYSNAMSLESARRKGIDYAGWLSVRLNRLVGPLLLLVVAWALLGLIMEVLGARGMVIQYASKASLTPTWFLAIYIMVVVLAPATWYLWQRFGFWSFWSFAAAAALMDIAYFAADLRWLGWSNYFWVWLAVHHLGFAWRDHRFGSSLQLLGIGTLGFFSLWFLISAGPYPLAMVGSPDEGLSNTTPPKVTLIALALTQFGLLLALDRPMRRLLASVRLWTATVLVNSMIMTIYLWHITLMIVVIGLLFLADGLGLGLEPGGRGWWISRPLWILLLSALLLPVAIVLSPLEQRSRQIDLLPPTPGRQVGGATLLCTGIALLAMFGYGGGPIPGLDLAAFALVVVGAGISGLLPTIPREK